jgi:hypothetical protein
MIRPHIQIDGLRELQRDLKASQGKLPKALGEAHKNVGRFVISKVPQGDPHAVGAGSGATIRPSATKRDVLLRVGHGARPLVGKTGGAAQWGKARVMPFAPGPHSRPYIVGTIEQNRGAIVEKFLDETMKALKSVFGNAAQ